MEEIRRENHLGCIPNLVNNGIFSPCFPSTGDFNTPDFWTSHQLRYGMLAPWCFVVETKRLPEVGKWRPMLKLYHYFESPLGKWSILTLTHIFTKHGLFGKQNHPAGWVGIDCLVAPLRSHRICSWGSLLTVLQPNNHWWFADVFLRWKDKGCKVENIKRPQKWGKM